MLSHLKSQLLKQTIIVETFNNSSSQHDIKKMLMWTIIAFKEKVQFRKDGDDRAADMLCVQFKSLL